jgi:ubiquinol oxidase
MHYAPQDWRDRVALRVVKLMRTVPDMFFAKRYGHRAVVLETVAAVPGMVGGLLQHLKAIRHIREDQGWTKGLIEEEAVTSYTQYLAEIDAGKIENIEAPDIAKEYWNLPDDAHLRDVVLVIRADEAAHRDTNHTFANAIVDKSAP